MEPTFTRPKLIQQCFVKNPDTEFHESGLVAETRTQTDRRTDRRPCLHLRRCLSYVVNKAKSGLTVKAGIFVTDGALQHTHLLRSTRTAYKDSARTAQ